MLNSYNNCDNMLKGVKMLSINEVAKELKVCYLTIARHLNNGTIKGVKIGGVWRIDEKELERIKQEGYSKKFM